METIHATCVSIGGKGVLIAGKSGSGKSDLALRLIDAGAMLVSDDRTVLSLLDGALMASPPPQIAGMIEVRGLGILRVPYDSSVNVTLHVRLVDETEKPERLPEEENIVLMGLAVRSIGLHAQEASAAAKVRAFLSYPMVDARGEA